MLRRGLILDLSIGLGMFSFFSLFSFDLDLADGLGFGENRSRICVWQCLLVGFCFLELLKGGIGNGLANLGDWNIGTATTCLGSTLVMRTTASWRRLALLDRATKGYDYMVVN